MSRSFVAASSQFLEIEEALISAYPLTMACWFKSNDVTGGYSAMFVGDKDQDDHWLALRIVGNVAGDPVGAFSHDYGGAAGRRADTSTGFSANTWHHACGTWAGISNRIAYIDGGSKIEDTGTVGALTGHDRTSIGRWGDSTPGGYMDGLIAEVCIWNVVLTDEEVAALAAGVHPRRIRPASLIHYWPFRDSNLTDVIGGKVLTNTGTTMATDHPSLTSSMPPIIVQAEQPALEASLLTVDVVPMRARVEPYPIARWDVVPFDRIPNPWKPGVVAFHQDGISKVEFTVAGQGWSGATPIIVTTPTFNDQTGVYDYHPTITHSQFSSNGVITIEAKVFPDNAYGQNRDKNKGQGEGLGSLSFVVDQDGTLRQTVAWVSPTGNDGTAVIGDRGLPYLNPHKAAEAINTADGDCDGAIVYMEAGTYAVGGDITVTTTNEWLTFMPALGVARDAIKIDNIGSPPFAPDTKLLKFKNITATGSGPIHPQTTAGNRLWVDACILDGGDRFGSVHPISNLGGSITSYGTGTETRNCGDGWKETKMVRGCYVHAINNDPMRDCLCVIDCLIEDTDPGETGNHCDGFQITTATTAPYNILWYNNRVTNMESRAFLTSNTVAIVGMAVVNMYCHQIAVPNGGAIVILQQSIDHFICWNCTFVKTPDNTTQFRFTDLSGEPTGTPMFLANVSVKGNHFTYVRMQWGDDRNFEPDTGWDRNNYYDPDNPGGIGKQWGTNKTTADPALTQSGFPGSGSSLIDTLPTPLVLEDTGGTVRGTPSDAGAYEEGVEGGLSTIVVDVIPLPFNDLALLVVDVTPYKAAVLGGQPTMRRWGGSVQPIGAQRIGRGW